MRKLPFGALIALITAGCARLAIQADPRGLGRDPALRGPVKVIGAGGLVWLAFAGLKSLIRRCRL